MIAMLRWLLALVMLACAAPAWAAPEVRNTNATVSLHAETARPAPGGTVTLGIRIAARPGWHSYWENPGESGIENRYAWSLPPGATAAEPRYPVPRRLVVSGIMNYVFDGAPVILADIRVPADAKPGAAFPVGLKLDYLICSDELCVPESAELSLPLTVGDGAPDPARAALFREARAALPTPLKATATFERAKDRFRLAVPLAAPAEGAYFFPLTDGALTYSAPQRVGRAGDRLIVETAAGPDAALKEVEGVLVVLRATGAPAAFALAAARGAVPAIRPGDMVLTAAALPGGPAAPAASDKTSLLTTLLLAFAGGLLLNVMPCVFPILSLKALSLARSGETEAQARAEARAYTGGVLLAVGGLGAVIIGLKQAGTLVGWAFQLTDPRAILALLLLVTAVALNLAGLFEVRAGAVGGERLAARPGASGAFWTGVLAAAVATPCSGPFMGAAIGAALFALSPLGGFLVFLGLALGLAAPFLALGYIPALRRRLPRPGPWMERLKHILSVPMFLTAIALAWVLGRQAGVPGMTLGLAAATALGLALWWFGANQRGGRASLAPLGLGLAVAVAAALTVTAVPQPAAAKAEASGPLAAAPFSEAALAAARAGGRPVFVYFTADWCITCKVNERGAMADAGVRAAFERAGVAVLEGDWTRGDAAITRFLAARGRSGVPLYLFYGADGGERVLPQLLTAATLTSLVPVTPSA